MAGYIFRTTSAVREGATVLYKREETRSIQAASGNMRKRMPMISQYLSIIVWSAVSVNAKRPIEIINETIPKKSRRNFLRLTGAVLAYISASLIGARIVRLPYGFWLFM